MRALLQAVNADELWRYLSKVASSAGGIKNGQLKFLVGTEDKDGTAGYGHATHADLGIDHTKLVGKLSAGIGNDGIIEAAEPVVALDVLDPSKVILNTVAREGNNLLEQNGEMLA